jgi:hypothetical protein
LFDVAKMEIFLQEPSVRVLKHGFSPGRAAEQFIDPSASLKLHPFRDATFRSEGHCLLLLHCLKGLFRSVKLGWFNMGTFSLSQYKRFDNLENGDVHRLCPKLVAFRGQLADQLRG